MQQIPKLLEIFRVLTFFQSAQNVWEYMKKICQPL